MSPVVIPDELDGLRLDVVLARLADISRGAARRAIDAGGVFLDGRRERTLAHTARAGAELRWTLAAPAADVPDLSLDVVHEDARWLVVCKQPGLPTVPGPAGGDSLLGRVQALQRGQGRPQLAESHRLDRETSGLLCFGRDPDAVAALDRALARRQVGRGYLALVRCLRPPVAQRIDAALRPAPHAGVEVHPCGQPAATRALPLAFDPERGVALVAITLETGRSHQARAHLSYALGPIVGDQRYGDPLAADARAGLAAPRVALHSARLGMRDPATGAARSWHRAPDAGFFELGGWQQPLPETWTAILRELGRGEFDPERALAAI